MQQLTEEKKAKEKHKEKEKTNKQIILKKKPLGCFDCILDQKMGNIFCKEPNSIHLIFATIQLYCCGVKAVLDNSLKNGCGFMSIKFYLSKQVTSRIWQMDPN